MPIDRDELLRHLKDGKIVGVKFIKRNGDLRRIAARLGVESYLRGGELNYDPAKKNLVTVFDMHKQGYRQIPCDRVTEVSAHGSVVFSDKLPEEDT